LKTVSNVINFTNLFKSVKTVKLNIKMLYRANSCNKQKFSRFSISFVGRYFLNLLHNIFFVLLLTLGIVTSVTEFKLNFIQTSLILKFLKKNSKNIFNFLLLVLGLILSFNNIPYEEVSELMMILILHTKKPLYLCCKIKLTIQVRFMKRLVKDIVLTPIQKKYIAQGTELFLSCIFSTPFRTKDEFILRVWRYVEHCGLGEDLFKQTLLKGFFSKLTFSKEQIAFFAKKHDSLNKVILEDKNEIVDVRNFLEYSTMQKFANSSQQIQSLTSLNESPKILNKKKKIQTDAEETLQKSKGTQQSLYDAKVTVETIHGNIEYSCDIKAGNNMFEPFTRVIGNIWLKEDKKPFAITNNEISLAQIQASRLHVLKNYLKYNSDLLDKNQIEVFNGFFDEFKCLLSLDISDVKKNAIIQEALLKILVYNLPNLNASFYVISQMENFKFNPLFEERLAVYIKPDIFNNYENFHKFMHNAINIYQNAFEIDLIRNIENSKGTFWAGTGFENIANDVFN
jgi:hypothetical protein